MNKLKSILENKNVIIVGPADYILKLNNGKKIDEYNVVIRIKKGFPVVNEYINHLGRKTTIVSTTLKSYEQPYDNGKYKYMQNNFSKENFNLMIDENIKMIFPYPILKLPFNKFHKTFHKKFDEIVLDKIDLIEDVIDEESYQAYQEKIYNNNITNPSIFLMTFLLVLKSNPSKIAITGFDFRKGGYIKNYKNTTIDKLSKKVTTNLYCHNFDSEFDYFIKMYDENNKIYVDSFFYDNYLSNKHRDKRIL